MIISLRKLHDLEPDELEVLRRNRANSQNSGSRSTSSQGNHLKSAKLLVPKVMIPIKQATDLNVIGGKMVESTEKDKKIVQHVFILQ